MQLDFLQAFFCPISSSKFSRACSASVLCSNEADINISIKREQLFLMSDVISYGCDYNTTLTFPVKRTKCICAFVKINNNSLEHRSVAKPCEESLFHSLRCSAHHVSTELGRRNCSSTKRQNFPILLLSHLLLWIHALQWQSFRETEVQKGQLSGTSWGIQRIE